LGRTGETCDVWKTVISRTLAGKAFIAAGAVGIVASLLGMVVAVAVTAELDRSMRRSLELTGEALEALDASVDVAEETVILVERSLASTEATTRDLVVAFEDGEALLAATADLSEGQIASSLEAVENALPTLIEVAEVMDTTLTALSALPFGPSYDPDEPFDDSLRAVQAELDGLPDDLRAQADLIREAGANLGTVGEGTAAIADDLGGLRDTLDTAASVLGTYARTADEARDLVQQSESNLGRQLVTLRLLIVVGGLAVAAGQVVPLSIGWALRNPDAFRTFLAS
jgi:ABC-type transporter Mla subunit MlaD